MKAIVFVSFLICFFGLASQIDANVRAKIKDFSMESCPPYDEVPMDQCAVMLLMYRPPCTTDADCSEFKGQKCCPNICNQQYCQDPVAVITSDSNNNNCPPIKPLPDDVCERARFSSCSSDNDCLVGQYCCTGPCGTPTCLRTPKSTVLRKKREIDD